MSEKVRFKKKGSGQSNASTPWMNIPVKLEEKLNASNLFSASVLVDIDDMNISKGDVIKVQFSPESKSKSLTPNFLVSLDKAKKGQDDVYAVDYSTRIATAKEAKSNDKDIKTGLVSVSRREKEGKVSFTVRVASPEFAEVVSSEKEIVSAIGKILSYQDAGTPGFIFIGRDKTSTKEEATNDAGSRFASAFPCYPERVANADGSVTYKEKTAQEYFADFKEKNPEIVEAASDAESGWIFEIVPMTYYRTSPNFGGDTSKYDPSKEFKTYVNYENGDVKEVRQVDGFAQGFVCLLTKDQEDNDRPKALRAVYLAHTFVPSFTPVHTTEIATPALTDNSELKGHYEFIQDNLGLVEERRKAFKEANSPKQESEAPKP